MYCDFCTEPHPTWGYPAKDFALETGLPIGILSDGWWAACDTCHDLIEADNRTALLTRALDKLVGQVPMEYARPMMTDLHGKFFAHRCGPAVREAA